MNVLIRLNKSILNQVFRVVGVVGSVTKEFEKPVSITFDQFRKSSSAAFL